MSESNVVNIRPSCRLAKSSTYGLVSAPESTPSRIRLSFPRFTASRHNGQRSVGLALDPLALEDLWLELSKVTISALSTHSVSAATSAAAAAVCPSDLAMSAAVCRPDCA